MSGSPTSTTTTTTTTLPRKSPTNGPSSHSVASQPSANRISSQAPDGPNMLLRSPPSAPTDDNDDLLTKADLEAELRPLEQASMSEIKLEEADVDPSQHPAIALDMELDVIPGSDPSSSSSEGEYTRELTEDQRRVKVYELIDNKWTDKGTAFCHSAYDEEKQMAQLIARSEERPEDIVLQFVIRGEEVYQRQQDTLIVWTEPDGKDFALSFQDAEGCADVWDYILDVQRAINGDRERDENIEPLSSSPIGSRPITFASIVHATQLPPPQFGIMLEVGKAIKHVGRNIQLRDRLCEHVINTDYVHSMIDLANQAEDLEQVEELHAICNCMQAILLLNDHSIFEHVISEPLFTGVCGILEYDPEFPNHKACYRDILSHQSLFKQPIEFSDESVHRKIQQTYRLQFLKDVVLTRVMEDSTFNVLNSCIIFNQIDIINHIQTDEPFLRQIDGLFTGALSATKSKSREMNGDEGSSKGSSSSNSFASLSTIADEELQVRKRDVVFLIQQLCVMGKNVQLQARIMLFRTLVDRGLVRAVQWGLIQPEVAIINTSAEILGVFLEHDTNGVRQHIMRQADLDSDGSLMNILSVALAGPGDLALKNQLADCLKSLLETQPPDSPEAVVTGIKALIRQREDPITEKFLEYIYSKGCMKSLFKPLADIPEFKVMPDANLLHTSDRSTLYFYLTDLLCSSLQQHGFRSSHFILDSVVSPRIASLFVSRDKHLRLVALRFFRSCLKLNNRAILVHLMKHDVLLPIVQLTLRESRRDNLLSSGCQEFFEYIRRENLKELVNHIMTRHEQPIRTLADNPIAGPRFKGLILRWEQNMEPPPPAEKKTSDSANTRWGHSRSGMEWEEENWFNGSDDDDTPGPQPPWIQQPLGSQQPHKRKRGFRPNLHLGWTNRRRQAPSPTPANSPPSTSLVDYEGDDDTAPVGNSSPVARVVEPSGSTGELSTPMLSQQSSSSQSLRVRAPQPIKLPTLDSAELFQSESAVTSTGGGHPPRRSEKRRRQDDEDDEMLTRLSSKSRRTALSDTEEETSPGSLPTPTGTKEEVKKIKLKLGSIALGLSSALKPKTSNGNAKDGDGG